MNLSSLAQKARQVFSRPAAAATADMINSEQRKELADYVMKACRGRPDFRMCEDEVRKGPAFQRLFGKVQPKIFF